MTSKAQSRREKILTNYTSSKFKTFVLKMTVKKTTIYRLVENVCKSHIQQRICNLTYKNSQSSMVRKQPNLKVGK